MRLEYVIWRDHWSSGDDWVDIDEEVDTPLAPLLCQSVGWVLSEDRKMLKLVSNLDGEPDVADHGFGVTLILKDAIVSRVPLAVPVKTRRRKRQ